MRVPGWKSVRGVGRWARSRVTGAALILGYHRVGDAARDPYGLCVSPRHFEEQMEVLRRRATPKALSDVLGGLGRADRRRGHVAVTFDDGYADFVRHAEPVLRRCGVPATVFVVSGSTGQRLWWDELADVVLDPTLDETAIEAVLVAASDAHTSRAPLVGPVFDRRRMLATAHRWLLGCTARQRQEVLGRLRAQRSKATAADAENETLAEHELARLAHSGLITIGSHTVNHPALATISEDEQLFELSESRRRLEEITSHPVLDLSYPHGSNGAATRRLARQSGYRCACASNPDVVSFRSDFFCLPRFWVPDWDGDRFGRWLQRWQL